MTLAAPQQELSYFQAKAQFTRAFAAALASRPGSSARRSGIPGVAGDNGNSVQASEASLVAPGLLLSSWEVEQSAELVSSLNVSHVLQVGAELSPTHAGLVYLTLPLHDLEEEDLVSMLPACFQFLQQAQASGGVALVHCMAGVSRSAAVVICFLMWTRGLSFVDARAAVKAARPRINLNLGFTLQIQELERLRHAGLVPWGDTPSLAASLQQHWQPWSLERFLEVREKLEASGVGADDRTLRGGADTGEASLQLGLESEGEDEEAAENGDDLGAQQHARDVGWRGCGADQGVRGAAGGAGAGDSSGLGAALEAAVRSGRIALSDYEGRAAPPTDSMPGSMLVVAPGPVVSEGAAMAGPGATAGPAWFRGNSAATMPPAPPTAQGLPTRAESLLLQGLPAQGNGLLAQDVPSQTLPFQARGLPLPDASSTTGGLPPQGPVSQAKGMPHAQNPAPGVRLSPLVRSLSLQARPRVDPIPPLPASALAAVGALPRRRPGGVDPISPSPASILGTGGALALLDRRASGVPLGSLQAVGVERSAPGPAPWGGEAGAARGGGSRGAAAGASDGSGGGGCGSECGSARDLAVCGVGLGPRSAEDSRGGEADARHAPTDSPGSDLVLDSNSNAASYAPEAQAWWQVAFAGPSPPVPSLSPPSDPAPGSAPLPPVLHASASTAPQPQPPSRLSGASSAHAGAAADPPLVGRSPAYLPLSPPATPPQFHACSPAHIRVRPHPGVRASSRAGLGTCAPKGCESPRVPSQRAGSPRLLSREGLDPSPLNPGAMMEYARALQQAACGSPSAPDNVSSPLANPFPMPAVASTSRSSADPRGRGRGSGLQGVVASGLIRPTDCASSVLHQIKVESDPKDCPVYALNPGQGPAPALGTGPAPAAPVARAGGLSLPPLGSGSPASAGERVPLAPGGAGVGCDGPLSPGSTGSSRGLGQPPSSRGVARGGSSMDVRQQQSHGLAARAASILDSMGQAPGDEAGDGAGDGAAPGLTGGRLRASLEGVSEHAWSPRTTRALAEHLHRSGLSLEAGGASQLLLSLPKGVKAPGGPGSSRPSTATSVLSSSISFGSVRSSLTLSTVGGCVAGGHAGCGGGGGSRMGYGSDAAAGGVSLSGSGDAWCDLLDPPQQFIRSDSCANSVTSGSVPPSGLPLPQRHMPNGLRKAPDAPTCSAGRGAKCLAGAGMAAAEGSHLRAPCSAMQPPRPLTSPAMQAVPLDAAAAAPALAGVGPGRAFVPV